MSIGAVNTGSRVVFDQVRALSTLITFVWALTHGHVRWLTVVLRQEL
jgi:hypothetical protein